MPLFKGRSAAVSAVYRMVLSAGFTITMVGVPGAICSAGPVSFRTIAYTSQQASGLPPGTVFADLADPRVDSLDGYAAFWAKLAGPGITAGNDTSLWFTPLGGLDLQLAIREGDAAAGTPDPITGLSTPLFGRFNIVTTTASFNTVAQPTSLGLVDAVGANAPSLLLREDASFAGLGLADASQGGHLLVRSGDGNSIRQANFIEPFTELIKVGDPALNTGLPDAAIARLWDPSQGGFQNIIFRADITYTGQTAPMTGLFVSHGTQPSCIARLGSPAPEVGPGAVFSDFSASPRINGNGSYFWATVTPASGPKVSAIYREYNTSIGLIVRSGIDAPGLPGLTLASIDRAVEVSGDEPIVFSGSLSGPGVTASNNSAIWTWDHTFGFNLIAREGDQAPGCSAGTVFGTLGRPGISNGGPVAFTAWLSGPNVTAASNYALFAGNSYNKTLSLIARTGSAFQLPAPASGTRVIKDIIFDQGPNQSGLSQQLGSVLVFKLNFTDASAGLFSAYVSECAADLNNDGFVNGDDYDLYADYFEAGDPRADFNNDGFVTGDDFDLFSDAFVVGC